jgi:hypothetical protein
MTVRQVERATKKQAGWLGLEQLKVDVADCCLPKFAQLLISIELLNELHYILLSIVLFNTRARHVEQPKVCQSRVRTSSETMRSPKP